MRCIVTVAAGLAMALSPGWANAASGWELNAGMQGQGLWHRSWDAVDDDDHLLTVRGSLGYGFEVPGGSAVIDLAYARGSTSAMLHAMTSELLLEGVELGVSYRWALARLFQPFVRLGLGYDWAKLSLGTRPLSQRVGNLAGSGAVGFSVPLVARQRADGRWHPTISLDFAAGYVMRPRYAFDAVKGEPDEDEKDPLAAAPVNLGKLALSAVSYRVGLSARF